MTSQFTWKRKGSSIYLYFQKNKGSKHLSSTQVRINGIRIYVHDDDRIKNNLESVQSALKTSFTKTALKREYRRWKA